MKKILLISFCLTAIILFTSCAEFRRGTMDTTNMSDQADTIDDSVTTDDGSNLGDGEQMSGNGEKKKESDKEEDDNNASQSTLDSELTSILNAIYANADVEEFPTLIDVKVTKDNVEYFFGTEFEFDKGVSREPLVSAVPHSVSVVRVKNTDEIEAIKEKILQNIDTDRWLFNKIEKEKIIVDSKGDIIVLIITNEYGENLRKSFLMLDI